MRDDVEHDAIQQDLPEDLGPTQYQHSWALNADDLVVQENTENWPWEAVVLIGWLVLLRILVYVALRFKTAAPSMQQHSVAQ